MSKEKRLRRAMLHRLAVAKTGPYQAENDRLWQQEQSRAGGGLAGWVMYDVAPTNSTCKLTGRITREWQYRIPKFMPTGARPPMLDKRLDLFKAK